MENNNLGDHNNCIHTFTGSKLSFKAPTPEQIDIIDIAKGLSTTPHFRGQSKEMFTVAEHSLLVLQLMDREVEPRLLLAALLHDASEAYTGDVPKPLKDMIPQFKPVEKRITKAIFKKYGLEYSLLARVKYYDNLAQRIEFNEFFKGWESLQLHYYNPVMAYHKFMAEFNRLFEVTSSPVFKYIQNNVITIPEDMISEADAILVKRVNKMELHDYDIMASRQAESEIVRVLVKSIINRLFHKEEAQSGLA